jgi:hypothetical protein
VQTGLRSPPQDAQGARARIDGFELRSRLGIGPRSEVWHARARGADVAVKIFSPSLVQQAHFLTVFEKETAPLIGIAHPNIVTARERGRSGSDYYLTCEWMPGGSLRDTMRRGPLPVARVLEIGIGICEALDHAHRRGMPHRNLVAENVFVDDGDHVKVSDFGLSLLHGTAMDAVAPGDARSDLHALGALLYELVSGSRPSSEYVPLSRTVPGVPARVDDLLGRALGSDAAQRFGRAGEMALALRLAGAGPREPTGAVPSSAAVSVKGRVVSVAVSAGATADTLRAPFAELDRHLAQPGSWRIAYDLGALSILDEDVAELMLRAHMRHQRKLDRIAFCSPRSLVRSGTLLLAGSVKRVPTRVFAAAPPMRAWIEQEGAR